MRQNRIVLGSISELKERALRQALSELGNLNAEINCVETRTGLPPQPVGLEQTLLGAVRRAEYAKAAETALGVEQGTVYVGIENGLIVLPGALAVDNLDEWAIDLAVVYVLPGHGSKPRVVTSLGVSIPPEITVKALKMQSMSGLTIGELLAERVSSNKNDPHKHLCGISRVEILASALCAALKPILSLEGGGS